jgi:NAD-dependent dihydropyrimidine dehydrogenase PreA subunit
MYDILEKITLGKGTEEDLATLEDLSNMIVESSLCALGGSAPNPVITSLKYFKDEYLVHVREKKCPAKACRQLNVYSIDENICATIGHGCDVCTKQCPDYAIYGEPKKAHKIDQLKCHKCGACYDACNFKAIKID